MSGSTSNGAFTYFGVNISGGEFGSNVPGVLGTDYTYPTQAEIDYWASQGMNTIRVPFLLERLFQDNGTNSQFSQADLTALQNVVSEAAAVGITVDLDPHDYGDLNGQEILPGTTTEQEYDADMQALAGAFAGDSNVIFSLMNEPNQQTPTQQAQLDNDAIAAIRAGGANQLILVPGTDWDGAWTWTSSGNAAAINPSTIHDPDNNWAIEVHKYLDSDGSGTNYSPITNAQIGVQRLTAVTQWAEQNGVKLFLGEFGVPGDSQSLTAMDNMLSYMQQNDTANGGPWLGGTYWSSVAAD
jgi:endoglucanase